VSVNSQDDQGSSPKYAAKVPESIQTPDVVETSRLGRLEFFDGMPSDETVRKVYDQLDFSRGVETFLTGCPAASVYAFLQGMKEAGMGTFSMGIHEQLFDARTLWLTPNTTTVYCVAEINVQHGPTVMEVPPGVLGLVDDAYFRWVTDVGFTGPDRGQGGKEGNWVQTLRGKSWSALLRLYGPLEPWFDKSWKPGDFELVDG